MDFFEVNNFFRNNGFEQHKLIGDEIFAKRVAFECLRLHYVINPVNAHKDEKAEIFKLIFENALYSAGAYIITIGKVYNDKFTLFIETNFSRHSPDNAFVNVYLESKDKKYNAEIIRFDRNLQHTTGRNIICGMLDNTPHNSVISDNISVISRYNINELYSAISNEIQGVKDEVFKKLNATEYFSLIAANE